MRIYRVRNMGEETWCYVTENELGSTVLSWIDGMTYGYGIEVQPTNMTEKQYNKLPDFEK